MRYEKSFQFRHSTTSIHTIYVLCAATTIIPEPTSFQTFCITINLKRAKNPSFFFLFRFSAWIRMRSDENPIRNILNNFAAEKKSAIFLVCKNKKKKKMCICCLLVTHSFSWPNEGKHGQYRVRGNKSAIYLHKNMVKSPRIIRPKCWRYYFLMLKILAVICSKVHTKFIAFDVSSWLYPPLDLVFTFDTIAN